jgi:uncharacterized protein YbbC (DUF1343 family)
MARVALGLDRLREEEWKKLRGCRLGLLSNQASLDGRLHPAKEVIHQLLPGQLKALFGPQHGYGGQDQDNMVETEHAYDEALGIPIFSLYSRSREPLPEMLDLIDLLVIDLQDVGTRVYTFAATVLNCLKAAAGAGKKVFVLDRPNPLGGETVEGNLLREELYSFVGPFKFPMRHGLTMGEMARIFDACFGLEAELEIISMDGWHRDMMWQDTGLQWMLPSPNMPLYETALVYPGQVIWEGTNISEGRGTCRPFEIFGAPFFDPKRIRESLKDEMTEGCTLQEISFRPTFHKWAEKLCRGFMIHVMDPRKFRPYFCTISLLASVLTLHREHFSWKAPPYEYEFDRRPIDLIIGDTALREEIERGADLFELRGRLEKESACFCEWRRQYLLYS